MAAIDPLTAGAVFLATAAHRRRLCHVHLGRDRAQARAGGDLERIWYVLSSYAVISYTENWFYVAFAAIGSWVGAYLTHLPAPPARRPAGGGGAGVRACVGQAVTKTQGASA